MTTAEAREFLEAAYRAVFRRPADTGGLDGYSRLMAEGMSPTEVLRAFLGSDEFSRSLGARIDGYDAQSDPALLPFRSSESEALATDLASLRWLDAGLFEALHQDACRRGHVPGLEYPADHLQLHKRRFAEMLNACGRLLQGRRRPRLLDIGSTQNLPWYKAVIGDLELVSADRPGGPTYPESDHHVVIDLNGGNLAPLAARAPYDLIVFTEVIEHLSVNPALVLRQLIELLSADGALYLTTPNVFRFDNLRKIGLRENPQPVYPLDNSDCHHHTREYAMGELLRFVREAGGRVRCWYFSDCWDDAPVRVEERGNLVVVAGR